MTMRLWPTYIVYCWWFWGFWSTHWEKRRWKSPPVSVTTYRVGQKSVCVEQNNYFWNCPPLRPPGYCELWKSTIIHLANPVLGWINAGASCVCSLYVCWHQSKGLSFASFLTKRSLIRAMSLFSLLPLTSIYVCGKRSRTWVSYLQKFGLGARLNREPLRQHVFAPFPNCRSWGILCNWAKLYEWNTCPYAL